MDPFIYKPGAYKSPGIYKGEGGIYKGRGVYKDGESGGITEIEIGGKIYPVKKIGSLYWTTEHLTANGPDLGITGYWPVGKPGPQETYPGYFYNINSNSQYRSIMQAVQPFRVPTFNDYFNLRQECNDRTNAVIRTGYPNYPNATDETGFSAVPCGTFNLNSGVSLQGMDCQMLYVIVNSQGNFSSLGRCGLANNTSFSFTPISGTSECACLRFCMDA